MKLFLILFLSLTISFTFAGDHFNVFKTQGQFSKIDFVPESSPSKFSYDVFYYIPKKLSTQNNLNTLVFMHGGGQSTSTRSGSTRVIKMYNKDLMKMADTLGFILIMPSASGINWGSHTITFLKNLNKLIRKDLPTNPDKIALAGHSMGAMGITRTAHWLVDQYSFIMPLAGGMDPKYMTKEYLSPYFNMNYYHLQGLKDHFQIFVTRCREQDKKIKDLEVAYNKKSGFELTFYNGSHNYDYNLTLNKIKTLFKTIKRDLYQKEIYPIFFYDNAVRTDQWSNGNEYFAGPRDSYLWLKATEFKDKRKLISGDAQIIDNTINISLDKGVKTLRVYLSQKMLDLGKKVKINFNNKTVYNQIPVIKVDQQRLKLDAGYQFETYIDLNL